MACSDIEASSSADTGYVSTCISIRFVLLLAVSCSDRDRSSSAPSVELDEALSLSNAFLTTLDRNPKDLKLVKVENLIFRGPGSAGSAIWRFDYQERSLIPTKEHPLGGIGGGLFVQVDLDSKKATFLGVGE